MFLYNITHVLESPHPVLDCAVLGVGLICIWFFFYCIYMYFKSKRQWM